MINIGYVMMMCSLQQHWKKKFWIMESGKGGPLDTEVFSDGGKFFGRLFSIR